MGQMFSLVGPHKKRVADEILLGLKWAEHRSSLESRAMTSIFEGPFPKSKAEIPIKTGVIWVPGDHCLLVCLTFLK